MKWMICLLCSLIFVIESHAKTDDWGSTGHRAVGEIADQFLTRKARKNIEKLLNGQSLALVSTYGDDIKSDDRYDSFYTWHYVNMPFGVRYEESEKNPSGDLVTGIQQCVEVLNDDNASNADKAFYLKLLVHFIGDLHQPMHVGRADDRGGNDVKVQWFGRDTNLHSVWDSRMIDQFGMTYSELASNTDRLSKAQIKALEKGTVVDWVNETQTYAIEVYGSANQDENLRYRYMYDHFHLVRSQLQKAGIRLAVVLNGIFG